jgi:hypothetical protein
LSPAPDGVSRMAAPVPMMNNEAVLPDMKKRSFLARQPELRGSA